MNSRPVARIFRRGVTCVSDVNVYMHKHARLGGSGGMLSQKIFYKLDALRLLLRPFWDRNRAVVAIWIAEYCIRFLAVHVCVC